ncbi:MAG: hypothetical protein E7260_01540 [Lachnospiraceae bacterium]|nr:hypothetical protein [Lachnospiraceae bacterium]
MIYLWILMAVILLWLVYEWYEHTRIEYKSTDVECHKLKPDECLKLCLITDLHNNKKNLKQISEKVLAFSPDFILLPGDLTDKNNRKQTNAIAFLEMLASVAPTFYSLGNHEERIRQKDSGSWQKYVNRLPKGVYLLDNEAITENVHGLEVCLLGISLPEVFYKKGKLWNQISDLPTFKSNDGDVRILLAHHPEYAPWYGIYQPDLVVSGHLHGGLLRLPFVGGLVSPRFCIPKQDAGAYLYPYGTLFISRGLGSHTIPLRFFNRVELNFITLHGKIEENGE